MARPSSTGPGAWAQGCWAGNAWPFPSLRVLGFPAHFPFTLQRLCALEEERREEAG